MFIVAAILNEKSKLFYINPLLYTLYREGGQWGDTGIRGAGTGVKGHGTGVKVAEDGGKGGGGRGKRGRRTGEEWAG